MSQTWPFRSIIWHSARPKGFRLPLFAFHQKCISILNKTGPLAKSRSGVKRKLPSREKNPRSFSPSRAREDIARANRRASMITRRIRRYPATEHRHVTKETRTGSRFWPILEGIDKTPCQNDLLKWGSTRGGSCCETIIIRGNNSILLSHRSKIEK